MALSAHAQETVTYKFGWNGKNITYSEDDGSWSFDFQPAENVTVGVGGSVNQLQIGTAKGPYRDATLLHTPMSHVSNVTVRFTTNANHSKTLTVSVGNVEVATKPIEYKDKALTLSFDAPMPLDGEVKVTFSVKDKDLKEKSPAIYLYDISITSGGEAEAVVNAPTFEPAGGTFTEPFDLQLTADAGCTIHYTTDGTEATAASPVYSAPIHIDYGTTTVNAVAVDADGLTSENKSETYIVAEEVQLDLPRWKMCGGAALFI